MSNQGYEPPPGPPPNQQHPAVRGHNPFDESQPGAYQQYTGQPGGGHAAPPGTHPPRTDSFKESDFVPEGERGEQRESIQQFEMNRSQPESDTDRNVAALQQEFPSVDGSLIAALYGDAQSMGATREMLQELASQAQG